MSITQKITTTPESIFYRNAIAQKRSLVARDSFYYVEPNHSNEKDIAMQHHQIVNVLVYAFRANA